MLWLLPAMNAALILGGAECLWEDVERLEAMLGRPWPGQVVAVNEAGVYWPRAIDYWVSFHPEEFPGWEQRRAALGHPGGHVLCARRCFDIAERRVKPWGGGSSGLLAVSLASDVGFARAVLCGVPMDERRHFHDRDEGAPWVHADSHWKIWLENEARLRGWVRSMSGRTRELLGEPDLPWMEEAA